MNDERQLGTGVPLSQVEPKFKEFELPRPRVFKHQHFTFYIDDNRVESLITGQESYLTFRENAILINLCANPNRLLSRKQIYISVWQKDPLDNQLRTVDVYIHRIRKKLGDTSEKKIVIDTRSKRGFLLIDPDRPLEYKEVEMADESELKGKLYTHPDLDFFADSGEIKTVRGTEVLPYTTARVLEYLMQNTNVFNTVEKVLMEVWGQERFDELDPRTVSSHVSWIRQALKRIGIEEDIILSRHGFGYMLVDESKLPRKSAGGN